MALLLETNLRLLEQRLSALRATPYFTGDLQQYVNDLHDVISKTLTDINHLESHVVETITNEAWSATQYLSGSTTKLIPYEVVHCLRLALRDWTNGQFIITTAIIQERNFYFSEVNEEFYKFALAFTGVTFQHRLVQIQMPELYRQRPLYSIALYHELGHFLDRHRQITPFAQMLMTGDSDAALPELSGKPPGWSDDKYEYAKDAHLREYFADLFAACYVGSAIREFLGEFAPDQLMSMSHPGTHFRRQMIEVLLKGETNKVIDYFNLALNGLNLSPLSIRNERPEVMDVFDQVRPVAVQSEAELHGLFEAGWHALNEAQRRDRNPWNRLSAGDVERIVNDLTEKSIRNYMIRQKWGDEAT